MKKFLSCIFLIAIILASGCGEEVETNRNAEPEVVKSDQQDRTYSIQYLDETADQIKISILSVLSDLSVELKTSEDIVEKLMGSYSDEEPSDIIKAGDSYLFLSPSENLGGQHPILSVIYEDEAFPSIDESQYVALSQQDSSSIFAGNQYKFTATVTAYRGYMRPNMLYTVRAENGNEYIVLNNPSYNPIRLENEKEYNFYGVMTESPNTLRIQSIQ